MVLTSSQQCGIVLYMETTQNTSTIALIAARVNVGDVLADTGLTVTDYDTTARPGHVAWEMSDGSTRLASLIRTVEIVDTYSR